jgi:hypothetical protein
MQNSKLFHVLKTLSVKELNGFEKYLHSPFFNVNENMKQLFSIIEPHHPDYSDDALERECLFKSLFREESFDEKKIRYAISDLTKLLEDYLLLIEFKKENVLNKYFLLKSYSERDIEKYFLQSWEETNIAQQKNPYRNMEFYYHQYLLEENSYLFTSKKQNRALDTSLQNVVDNLEFFYIAKSLRYYCEIINRKNILSVDYNLRFLNEIMTHINNKAFEHVPAISIYHKILQTLTENKKEEYYHELIRLLEAHEAEFPKSEIHDMYTFAQNYCIKKVNAGNISYMKVLLDLYKKLLKKDLLFEGSILPQWYYKNIATIAIRVEDFEWAKSFIYEYKNKLALQHRENDFTFALAILYFSLKEYRKTLSLLIKVEYTDVFYHLDSKSLLLRTYYELEDWEPLLSLIITFKTYLKRNKLISGQYGETYLNFVNLVNKLVQYKMGKKINIREISDDIDSLNQIANISWLKKKVSDMS